MPYYLAIDAGGSKTDIVVFNGLEDAERISLPGIGISFESCEDLPELRDALAILTSRYDIASVVVNLGGKNKNQVSSVIKSCFPGAAAAVYRESEGRAALAFGKSCGASLVLMAGTGTITAGISPEGKYIIGGGWGMNIGDGGSGYDIGLNAVKEALLALDGDAPLTPLVREITGCSAPIAALEDVSVICNARDAVRARLFPIERRRIAQLAKLVASHCADREPDALALMERAGYAMARLVTDSLRKLPGVQPKVAVCGGLVGCAEYWKEAFEHSVRGRYPEADFIYQKDGLLNGVKLLAEKQVGG